MKLIEATESSRGYYFKVHINDEVPVDSDDAVFEEFRWSLGRKDPATREVVSPNDPDELIAEIKRQLSIKYDVPGKGTDLPQKGQTL